MSLNMFEEPHRGLIAAHIYPHYRNTALKEGDTLFKLRTGLSKYSLFSDPNDTNRLNLVTALDRFQSIDDFGNDLRRVLVLPVVCWFHSKLYAYKIFSELAISAVHLVTLSPYPAWKHLVNAAEAFLKVLAFDFMTYATFLCEALSFVLRTGITIGYGLVQAGAAIAECIRPEQEEELPDVEDGDQAKTGFKPGLAFNTDDAGPGEDPNTERGEENAGNFQYGCV